MYKITGVKVKGYFVFFDDEKESCLVIDLEIGQINIDFKQRDISIKKFSQIIDKPIKIIINPIDKNGKSNFVQTNIFRKKIGGFVEIEGEVIPQPQLTQYLETKCQYLKREKKFIKKTIKR